MDPLPPSSRVTPGGELGFIGTGTMGLPMALNLLRAGHPLVVWNRSAFKCEALVEAGARPAPNAAEVFEAAPIVLMSLANEGAIDEVLERGRLAFTMQLRGRTLVNLGTTSAQYSARLEADVVEAGGHYVEAPVSGSRMPAERGALVGMVAGHAPAVACIRPLLAPLCARVLACGAVPGAMRTKLAVNHYLIAMVAALGESVQAARAAQVDLELLREALDAGPMASEVSRLKLDKMLRGDYSAQASVQDAGTIAQLSLSQALSNGGEAPLLQACVGLYQAAERAGWRGLDMIAATRTLAPRA